MSPVGPVQGHGQRSAYTCAIVRMPISAALVTITATTAATAAIVATPCAVVTIAHVHTHVGRPNKVGRSRRLRTLSVSGFRLQ